MNDTKADVLTYSRLLKHEAYSRKERYPFERFSKLLDNTYYELKAVEQKLTGGHKSEVSEV